MAARERLVAAMEAMESSSNADKHTDSAATAAGWAGASADAALGSKPEPRADSRGAVGPLLAAARAWLP